MTARRLAIGASGFVGAELVGAVGFALGAALVATDVIGLAIPGLILAPVLAAAGGPLGYDVATSWAVEEAKVARGERGSRAALHAAGVAGALLIFASSLFLGAALPAPPTAAVAVLALLGLPTLAVAGRRFAHRFRISPTFLPMSLVAVVVTALGVFGGYIAFMIRVFTGDD